MLRNQIDPMWLNVRGRDRDTGGHADWAHLLIEVGDTLTLRVVDVDLSEIDAARQPSVAPENRQRP